MALYFIYLLFREGREREEVVETVKPTLTGQRYRGHEQTRGNKRKSQSKRNLMADFFFSLTLGKGNKVGVEGEKSYHRIL